MSVNAITSVSLYEYYYTLNKTEEKKSPLADEMKKYGLVPTNDEVLNTAMLQKAKKLQESKNNKNSDKEASYADRPWADIMYQLNISFNEDPADDIDDIKDELHKLIQGINDKELEQNIKDLQDYVEKLYLDYDRNSSGISDFTTLSSQLNNISMINKATLL